MQNPDKKRIALIHATKVSMDPIQSAFAELWPEVEAVNLLDDSLSVDRAANPDKSPALDKRIADLAEYADNLGSSAILYACSAFGSAIEAVANTLEIPVLKPNEAMFEAALNLGNRSAMLYTFEPAREGMESEFYDEAKLNRPNAEITSVFVPEAMDRLRAGDAETHNKLVAEKASELQGFDSIILAHFSTARAAAAVHRKTTIPVLSSPKAAVLKLRSLLNQ